MPDLPPAVEMMTPSLTEFGTVNIVAVLQSFAVHMGEGAGLRVVAVMYQ